MSYKKGFIRFSIVLSIGAFVLLGSGALNPAACAEQGYDVTACVSLDMTLMVQSPEMILGTYDCKGIMQSNNESKVFDNFTIHGQGVAMYEGKNRTINGYLKYLDPDGDFVIFRYTQNPGEQAATTKLLMGTGKWKGITGGGKATLITQGKPVAAGTVQFCNNHKGTFTLPK